MVLDIGASTGGFTQVCLAGGADRVYCVDVGRGQLHALVAADPRVTNLEGLDARRLDAEAIPHPPELIVCDASFIGLEKALPAALGLAAPGADLIALVKPQFEVGPARVGKGGVVKDESARQAALDGVSRFLEESGWRVLGSVDSPVEGADGNREYLLHARAPARPCRRPSRDWGCLTLRSGNLAEARRSTGPGAGCGAVAWTLRASGR